MIRGAGRRRRHRITLERQPDGVPKAGLFTEPVRVTRLEALETEVVEGGRHRVAFQVEVKDAEGRRCSDLAVDARITGPERAATVQGATDMFGRVKIRMTGPAGDYTLEVLEVAAKGLAFDLEAGPTTATVTVPDG